MAVLQKIHGSTIGKKAVVAVTGLILVGFLVGHVSGNLLFFAGAQKINDYSKFLHDSPVILWGTRLLLLASVAAHIIATLQLAMLRRSARPFGYQAEKKNVSSFATRTMILSGPLIAAFVVYHILHFTTGAAHPNFNAVDVHHNVLSAFQIWWVAAIYIGAMLILSGHLSHGIWSMLQTVGASHPKYDGAVRRAATLVAILIIIGFISVPLGILMGAGHGA